MLFILFVSLALSLYAVYRSVQDASYHTKDVQKDALKEDERFTENG